MVNKKYLFLILITLLISFFTKAQNIFFDEINLMKYQRNVQLIDTIKKVESSFLIRSTQNYQQIQSELSNRKYKNLIQNFHFGYDFVNNTLLPQNFNDGNMYPSRGWQERYIVGLQLKFGIIDINLQPEWLKLQNIPQEYYPGNNEDGNFMPKYFGSVANNIDNFRQFGLKKIDTFSMGQSRIGIKSGPLSIGYSNQNIWWGPGIINSIVFTNNAAGFKHLYLSSNKPIKSFIGNFEFSAISGILDTNWYSDPDIPLMRSIWPGGIVNKNLDQRKLDAITINWSPKWIPNLFLGYAYSRQYYKNTKNEYQELYNFYSKDFLKHEIGSFMFKFLLPKDHAEFYGELGIQNKAPWPWKFFSNDVYPGYIYGVTKLFKLTSFKRTFLNLNLEFTQLQLMDPRNIFYPNNPFVGGQFNSWYTNSKINQGYTNQGQIMGSSIGPGSNSQILNFSLNKDLNQLGISIERVVYNNDFFYVVYYNPYSYYGYYNKYWVNINQKIYLQIKILKKILLSASIMNTEAMNYRWIKNPDPGKKYDEPSSQTDKFNVQFQFSLKYLLHDKFQ